jgi:tetratricopeptide (TPR) repeat protein
MARSYLPSAGLAIALACLADLAGTRRGIGSTGRWLVPSGVAVVLLGLAAATVARHQVWRSPAALWKDTTAKSPNKVRPWMNLGTAFHERERWSSAVDCYRRAIRLAPHNSHAWTYLANTENAAGWHEQALATAQEHLRRDPSVVELHLARAMAYERLGQPQAALASLRECLDHKPNSRRARLGIGGLSLEAGNLAEATRPLEELRALGPLTPNQQRAFDRMEAAIAARKKLVDATRWRLRQFAFSSAWRRGLRRLA